MRRTVLLVALVLAATLSSLAQGFRHECSPAGTWYGGGGGPAKYLLTVTPTPQPGHFVITYDEGFTSPFPKLTEFSGELIRVGHNRYVGRAIALANTSPAKPREGGIAPMVAAIRETGRLADCSTLEFDIDFFALYEWGEIPFVSEKYVSQLPPAGVIHETYTRMAKSCPVCQSLPEEDVKHEDEPED